jgi:hypothetical protein
MTEPIITRQASWSRNERIFFRIIFIYCCLQALPLDWKYYRNIACIHWSRFSYRDLFYISRYTAQILSTHHHSLSWGMNGLADWGILAGIAVAVAVIWGYYDRRRGSYNDLYYVLRVILRYRLALAIMAYGFIKLFPMEQPYPSLSLLNTTYGSFSDWKIASLSYGVAPSLEIYLGAVEILAAILLLNRKSASFGAAIVIGFMGNVFLSNLGYGGGEAVYCLYLLTFAGILIFYDLPRWINLISLGRPTIPHVYRPSFYQGPFRKGRLIVKGGFIVAAFGLYAGLSLNQYLNGSYQYPRTGGLAEASGFYNVSEFRLNGQLRPYSLSDSLRWQNVILEKWNTLSIRTLQYVTPDLSNTEEIFVDDENRNYESSGSADRKFYTYRADSADHVLHLTNKNPSYKKDAWDLSYRRTGTDHLILSGINEKGDSVLAVLDKIKKVYLLDESYQIPKKRSVFQ